MHNVVKINSTREGIKRISPYDLADAVNRTGVVGDNLHSKTYFSF